MQTKQSKKKTKKSARHTGITLQTNTITRYNQHKHIITYIIYSGNIIIIWTSIIINNSVNNLCIIVKITLKTLSKHLVMGENMIHWLLLLLNAILDVAPLDDILLKTEDKQPACIKILLRSMIVWSTLTLVTFINIQVYISFAPNHSEFSIYDFQSQFKHPWWKSSTTLRQLSFKGDLAALLSVEQPFAPCWSINNNSNSQLMTAITIITLIDITLFIIDLSIYIYHFIILSFYQSIK